MNKFVLRGFPLFAILTTSFLVYAKTESGIALEGFYSTKKPTRSIANATNDGLNVLSQLGDQSPKPKPNAQVLSGFFGDSSGALTKKRAPANKKKSAK